MLGARRVALALPVLALLHSTRAQMFCSDVSQWSTCQACPAGRADADNNWATACNYCIAGHYAASNSTICSACAAGFHDHDTSPSTVCLQCNVGKYTPEKQTKCSDCAVGKVDLDLNSSSPCTQCPGGQYSVAGSVTCTKCGSGMYDHDRNSSTACVDCLAGKAQPLTGKTECDMCALGKYTSKGAQLCDKCAKGKYDGDDSPATACDICAAGSFATVPLGARFCSPCQRGYYTAAPLSVSCTPCVAGTYADTGSSRCGDCVAGFADTDQNAGTACAVCGAGTYSIRKATVCQACAAGKFDNDSVAKTPCVDCEPGKYSQASATVCQVCRGGTYSGSAATSCAGCKAGSYANASSSACSNCSKGEYAGDRAAVCTPCKAGRHDNDSSPATNCTPCWAGTYSALRATSCTLCTAGKLDADSNAATPCADCSVGRYGTAVGALSCTECVAGRFGATVGANHVDKCVRCPGSTYAGENSASCNRCPADLARAHTFVYFQNGSTEPYTGAKDAKACVCDAGTFAAGPTYDSRDISEHKCHPCENPDACPGGTEYERRGTCAVGYSGDFCATCSTNYYAYYDTCQRCPEKPLTRVFLFVGALMTFAIVLVKISSAMRFNAKADALNFKHLITPVVIVLTRGQSLGQIAYLKANWPPFVKTAAYYGLHITNIDLPSVMYPECQFDLDTSSSVVLFRVIFNATLFLLVCFFMFIIFMTYVCTGKDYSSLVNGVVASFALLYIVVLRVGFRTFDCTWMDNRMRLDMNAEIVCDWTSMTWLPIFFVGVLIIGIYGCLVPWSLWGSMQGGDLNDEDMMRKFGWMYARYRPGCFYFEFVLMFEKAALSAVTTFLTNRNRFNITWPIAIVITLASIVVQLKVLPYAECCLSRPLTSRSEHELTAMLDSDPRQFRGTGGCVLLKRWFYCLRHPFSANAIEVVGLTAQLSLLSCTAYFVFMDDNSSAVAVTVGVVSLLGPISFIFCALATMLRVIALRRHESMMNVDTESQMPELPTTGFLARLCVGPASSVDALVSSTWKLDDRQRAMSKRAKKLLMHVNLDTVYELSAWTRQKYEDEAEELSHGRVSKFRPGRKGTSMLDPESAEQKRLDFLQRRLNEHRLIRAARGLSTRKKKTVERRRLRQGSEANLEDIEEAWERGSGFFTSRRSPKSPKSPTSPHLCTKPKGLTKNIAILMFISKLYGPVARRREAVNTMLAEYTSDFGRPKSTKKKKQKKKKKPRVNKDDGAEGKKKPPRDSSKSMRHTSGSTKERHGEQHTERKKKKKHKKPAVDEGMEFFTARKTKRTRVRPTPLIVVPAGGE